MIKTAFSTLGCPELSFTEICNLARRLNIDGLEIRGIGENLDIDKIDELKPENFNKTLETLAGLDIVAFGSSLSFDDESKLKASVEEGIKTVDICAKLGIPAIRVFGNNIRDDDENVTLNRIARGISELCKYAETKNVAIWLEVHGEINTVARLKIITEAVSSPAFGLVWDVAHSDLRYRDNFPAFYLPLRHIIRHIHIKDHIRLDGATRLTLIGDGEIPLYGIISMLVDDKYDGSFSLEWERRWHPELPSLASALEGFTALTSKF